MRIFRIPLYIKLMRLFWFRFLKNKRLNKGSLKIIIYSLSFIMLCFWWLLIWILPFVYLGILCYRYKIFKKIGNPIRKHLHKSIHKTYHYFIALILVSVYTFLLFMFFAMGFTILIFAFILIGFFIEKRKCEPKKRESKTYVVKVSTISDIDKKESITSEYIDL